jgi:hypothetical protein
LPALVVLRPLCARAENKQNGEMRKIFNDFFFLLQIEEDLYYFKYKNAIV